VLSPAQLMSRLEEIEKDIAMREPVLEQAAQRWYVAKRDKEKARAEAFLSAEGTVAERSAEADKLTATMGAQDEAQFEAMRAVLRAMETRSMIGQSLLKAHGRAGA